jgi:hypothetical protein
MSSRGPRCVDSFPARRNTLALELAHADAPPLCSCCNIDGRVAENEPPCIIAGTKVCDAAAAAPVTVPVPVSVSAGGVSPISDSVSNAVSCCNECDNDFGGDADVGHVKAPSTVTGASDMNTSALTREDARSVDAVAVAVIEPDAAPATPF